MKSLGEDERLQKYMNDIRTRLKEDNASPDLAKQEKLFTIADEIIDLLDEEQSDPSLLTRSDLMSEALLAVLEWLEKQAITIADMHFTQKSIFIRNHLRSLLWLPNPHDRSTRGENNGEEEDTEDSNITIDGTIDPDTVAQEKDTVTEIEARTPEDIIQQRLKTILRSRQLEIIEILYGIGKYKAKVEEFLERKNKKPAKDKALIIDDAIALLNEIHRTPEVGNVYTKYGFLKIYEAALRKLRQSGTDLKDLLYH